VVPVVAVAVVVVGGCCNSPKQKIKMGHKRIWEKPSQFYCTPSNN
jgi:hypothetical protein